MRHGEWHVTVKGDPFQWRGFCTAIGIKPLWIELNNFETQLMCAANENPQKMIFQAGWEIVRVKHEVETFGLDVTVHQDQFPRGRSSRASRCPAGTCTGPTAGTSRSVRRCPSTQVLSPE